MALMDEFVNIKAAAEYLSRKIGRKITATSLHRQANKGTGPKYCNIMSRSYYTREDLDAWVESLVRPPAAKKSAIPKGEVL